MRRKLATPDSEIARVAARRHGIVTSGQLGAAGISSAGVSRRVRGGRLHRLHRGVYAVGHRGLSPEGRWLAAVLACGESAVLSHRHAAALWALISPPPGPVSVSVPGEGGRAGRAGIEVHRMRSLTSAQITRRNGIPVTTPARTLADLRRSVPAGELRRAIRQAEALGLPIGEGRGDPAGEPGDGTRSELEHLFLRLCRRHGLPQPEVNVRVGPFVVDFLWREQGLVVETDGYRYHRGRQAFEDDRARDLELRRRDLEVMRLSHAQVIGQSAAVAEALGARLSRLAD